MQRRALSGNADVTPADAAVAHESNGDELGCIDADRETDPLRRQDHGGVHADDVAARVHKWTTGVTRVERGIRLNDVVDETAALRTHGAPKRADDTGGDRPLKPIRTSHGDDNLTGTNVVGVA